MQNTNKEEAEKEKKDDLSSTGGLIEGIIEIPYHIGRTIVGAISSGDEETSGEGILDNVTQALASAKDAIGEHAPEILEGAAEVVKGVAGSIVDVISNIDA